VDSYPRRGADVRDVQLLAAETACAHLRVVATRRSPRQSGTAVVGATR
jgi:hypothetical protein